MDRKIIKSIEKFAEIVNKEFDVKKIILYGSYAKGTNNDYSDIIA
jgi:predicted nucleotidyltransferase